MMVNNVIILAGGKGTRLKEVSGDTPKSLVPVGHQRVFLDSILDRLAKAGVKRLILSLCYKPELFKNHLENSSYPFDIELVVEPSPLGTGGAVGFAIQQLGLSTPFAVINGDTYHEFDFDGMTREFQELQCSAMIGLSFVNDTGRYGSVICEQNRALAFKEKGVSCGTGWVNNGCYILSPHIFQKYKGAYSIERDVFVKLSEKKELYVYPMKGRFIDIGVPNDYYQFVALSPPWE